MVYRGHVKGGVVVFENGSPPEGAPVRVEVVRADDRRTPTAAGSIWSRLRKYSGAVSGLPADLARNHDHYIHGAPKTK